MVVFFFPFFLFTKFLATPSQLGGQGRPQQEQAVPGPGVSCLPCQSPYPLTRLLLKIIIMLILIIIVIIMRKELRLCPVAASPGS